MGAWAMLTPAGGRRSEVDEGEVTEECSGVEEGGCTGDDVTADLVGHDGVVPADAFGHRVRGDVALDQ